MQIYQLFIKANPDIVQSKIDCLYVMYISCITNCGMPLLMKILKNSAVPVMYISNHSDSIKRMPDIYGDYLLQIYEIVI
ncbi:hypothetical protein E2I00_019728 [Balaenoptera physalus]|uniref:Uncharacterized protein n=1 Tax=Balaenoptera physalus TaxID=9770 RepID=A0A643C7P6_BALPH|nr:hypothetical protein E2I00_019728 [Balaenoptera physalus]